MPLLTVSFSHTISLLVYFTCESPTCMQCMLGRLCDCTGVLVALGGWPLPHSSSLSYLFRSLPSCTSEHVMLGWHNVASVSSFVCYAVIFFIFSVSNFSSDTSHLTETKQLLHCTSLQCCFLLSVKLYVCFAHSAKKFVFSLFLH